MVSTVDGNLRGKKVAIFKNPKQYVQIWSCNEIILVWLVWITRWWFQIFFIFTPNYLGKISNLTVAYFSDGLVQPQTSDNRWACQTSLFPTNFPCRFKRGSHRLELMEIYNSFRSCTLPSTWICGWNPGGLQIRKAGWVMEGMELFVFNFRYKMIDVFPWFSECNSGDLIHSLEITRRFSYKYKSPTSCSSFFWDVLLSGPFFVGHLCLVTHVLSHLKCFSGWPRKFKTMWVDACYATSWHVSAVEET